MTALGPATPPFVEYLDVSAREPLRQGDVLEAVLADANMWQRHLLVITADCDFAHNKHQGRVTCVPLLQWDEYLSELQMPRLRSQFVTKQIRALQALLPEEAPAVSDLRLRQWASEEDASSIAAALGVPQQQSVKAIAALEAIQRVDREVRTLREAVGSLVDATLIAGAAKRETVLREVTARLRGCYSQPPGDALFLSAIASGCTAGYFAYLRHLDHVAEQEIALAPTRTVVRYRRISRLQERYAHALVQRFALVFMSIGLPDEYEEMRDLYSEMMGAQFQ